MTVLDASLLTVLACPCADHTELTEHAGGLRCASCHRVYRIDDGIPVLLMEEAATAEQRGS